MNKLQEKRMSMDKSGGRQKTDPYKEKNGMEQDFIF